MSRIAGNTAEIVEIELGFDRFEAQAILDACRAESFEVTLRQMDGEGIAPGFAALAAHRLLVWRTDLEAVMMIVARWREPDYPEVGLIGAPTPTTVPSRRVVRKVIGALLLLLIVVPAALQVVRAF